MDYDLACDDVIDVKNPTPVGDLSIILWDAHDGYLIDTVLSRKQRIWTSVLEQRAYDYYQQS